MPIDTSEWIFSVRLANGGLDDYNANDSIAETVFRSNGESWTLTFTTDFLDWTWDGL